jgi:hypothetical protein
MLSIVALDRIEDKTTSDYKHANPQPAEFLVRLLMNAGRQPRRLPFWQAFQARGLSARCFEPRDRIYNLRGVTGYDTKFLVDYSENIVETFWRVARPFRSVKHSVTSPRAL